MKNLINIAILTFSISLFSQEDINIGVGDKFPDFELETIEGEVVNLESLNGKVVFINMWFTSCKPCIEEMPTLNDLQNAYKDKVEFISITFNDAVNVKKFLSKNDFNFKHLVDAKEFLNDEINNKEYPRSLILDKNGKITYLRGGLPFTRDSETGEMIPKPYTFFEKPIEEALSN